jgi:hypothetical protein
LEVNIMSRYVLLLVLLAGVAIGVTAVLYGPDYLEPIFPKSAEGGIEGEVTSKLMEGSRLLITVKASEGAILVTFTKKVPEINLLVEKGDTVHLDLNSYKPFVDNPDINRVKKPDKKPGQKEEQPAQAEPAETMEQKPAQEKAKPEKSKPAKSEPQKDEPAAKEVPAAEEAEPVTTPAVPPKL